LERESGYTKEVITKCTNAIGKSRRISLNGNAPV
jgi:hypothetical protein